MKFAYSTAVLLALAATSVAQTVNPTKAPHQLTPAEEARVDSLVKRMTLQQKIRYIGGTGFAVMAIPELGLPALEMSDGPYGVRSNSGFPSTTYVAGIGLAASWDRDLAMAVGKGIGRDARARGVNYMLGPGVNIYRSPRNGRNFEYFGEDPFLSGEMASGYITGMQTQGVSSTVKHYLGNNSEYLRHDSDTLMDERTAREIYLPAFEAAVKKGGVGAVMNSYNLIDGKHATENGYFNIDVLRNEWGFKGTLMSDWVATYDGVAAANGGLDIEMPNGAFMNLKNLEPAVAAGTVKEATLDLKIKHILSTAMMFGWLDGSQRDMAVSVDSRESNQTALRGARESAVLLKNDGGLLPLDKKSVKTILVVGPNAYPGVPVGGGSAGVVPFHKTSLLDGLSMVADQTNVLYEIGLPSLKELASRTDFMTAESGGEAGLKFETFDDKGMTGSPTKTKTVKHVDVSGVGWDAISENLDEILAALSVGGQKTSGNRWTGYFNAKTAGDYLVAVAGAGESNGDRVTIDGNVVVDDWDVVRAFEPHLTMALSAGMHKVVVENWQTGLIGGKLRVAIVPESSVVTERAKKLAAMADVVVVAAGYQTTPDNESEGEGGDRTFDLPFGQDALIRAMAEANPKTIVTVTSGGNVDSQTWIAKVPALVEGWYGGQDGGQAMAEVLFGDVNPSGHLPATFERRAEDNPTYENYYPAAGTKRVEYKEGIFVGYRGYEKNGVQPLFPFGYGMSYTTFSFGHLKVAKSGAAELKVTFDVSNTGKRAGAEVAQVYVGEEQPKVARPKHELKAFERVELKAGETKHVSLTLPARAFAYYDVAGKGWKIDSGKFTISVGDSVANLPLTASEAVEGKGASF